MKTATQVKKWTLCVVAFAAFCFTSCEKDVLNKANTSTFEKQSTKGKIFEQQLDMVNLEGVEVIIETEDLKTIDKPSDEQLSVERSGIESRSCTGHQDFVFHYHTGTGQTEATERTVCFDYEPAAPNGGSIHTQIQPGIRKLEGLEDKTSSPDQRGYFLALRPTGQVFIGRITASGQTQISAYIASSGMQWTHIEALQEGTFMLYNRMTGNILVGEVNINGGWSQLASYGTQAGFTDFSYIGEEILLAYNANTGELVINHVPPYGFLQPMNATTIRPNLTELTALGEQNAQNFTGLGFMAYEAGNQVLHTFTLNPVNMTQIAATQRFQLFPIQEITQFEGNKFILTEQGGMIHIAYLSPNRDWAWEDSYLLTYQNQRTCVVANMR